MSRYAPYPKRATKADKEKFQRACAMLDELALKGYGIYLASDNMHLMIGETHTDSGRPLQENSAASANITGSGGGDW